MSRPHDDMNSSVTTHSSSDKTCGNDLFRHQKLQQGGIFGAPPTNTQQQQQQQQQQSFATAITAPTPKGCSNRVNSSNTAAVAMLDDAIGQFSSMTLGGNGGTTHGVDFPQHAAAVDAEPREAGGISAGVNMGALRLADGSSAGYHHQHQHPPPPLQQNPPHQETPSGAAVVQWGTHPHDHQHQQHHHQLQQQQQPCFVRAGGACCSSRGGQSQGQGGGGGRGPDGVWRDEQGQRMYTEAEVREAIEQGGRGWRERTSSLEADLAKMETDARAALTRAEQAIAEMAERLRVSEGKTYALSVHLAKSNRPPHLA